MASKEKIPGIILIVLAFMFNPAFLGYVVAEDNSINNNYLKGSIIFFEILLFAAGGYVLKNPQHMIKKRREYILLAASIIMVLFLFELLLHVYPQTLGQQFANGVLGKYNAKQDGIYYYDVNLNIYFMKPNFVTTNYYNGYFWEHKTDSNGFRNEEEKKEAQIILLGDSFIYGHGVDVHDTVGVLLENLSGKSTVNLGRQGDTSYQEMYILKQFGLSYKPKYVLYFFYENDIIDLYIHQVNLDDFLQNPYENSTWLNTERVNWAPDEQSPFAALFQKPYIMRAVSMVVQKWSVEKMKKKIADESEGWQYTEQAIVLMKNISEENNAQFIIVPITPSSKDQRRRLEDIALKNNILIINTSKIEESNSSLFLENDGHFSPAGAKIMAEIVADYIHEYEENI